MLDHADIQVVCEALVCHVEVLDHCATPPLSHKADGLWIHLGQEESHCPSGVSGARADDIGCETDGQARLPENPLDGRSDLCALHLCPFSGIMETSNGVFMVVI